MVQYLFCSLLILMAPGALLAHGTIPAKFEIGAPDLVLAGIPFTARVEAVDDQGALLADYQEEVILLQPGRGPRQGLRLSVKFDRGRALVKDLTISTAGLSKIIVEDARTSSSVEIRCVPGILSVLPPLLAIALALVFRHVIISLFAGIWLGSIILFDYRVLAGFFHVLDYFLINALRDISHMQIIVFSMLFGGMVGVITRNGGTKGIADVITRYARTPKGGQLAAWVMAFFLFFDDYANVLVRGNLMRPITDRLRISREKLAFLVDTGAATVASLFIISTWIGYEVGLIAQGLEMIESTESAYSMFIRTIPYRLYPFFALILAMLIALTGREIGPMYAAERRARVEGKVLRDGARPAADFQANDLIASDDTPARWFNGLLPIFAILAVGLAGLYLTGTGALEERGVRDYGLGDIVSAADSYKALLWASLSGCVVAILLTLLQRIMKLGGAMEAWVSGMNSMLLAMIILILAWSIGSVTEELHTADYLVQLLRGVLSPYWLPALTFIIAAVVAFSTGTSWATMAILMPLVIPLTHTLTTDASLSFLASDNILLGVISSVLAGSVFGDHCSPISDTTILSSMSSACDHIDHVRTQLPYALMAAVVGIMVGDLPTAYGFSPWLSLLIGTALMVAGLYLIGKKLPEVQPTTGHSELVDR